MKVFFRSLVVLLLLALPAAAQNFQGFLPTDTLMGRDTAGTGQVEIITLGTGLSMTGSGALQVSGASIVVTDPFTVRSTDAGNGTDPNIIADRDSASPAANDNLGEFDIQGNDSGLVDTTYAYWRGELLDPTDTSEDAEQRWAVMTAGTLAEELRLDGATLEPLTTLGLGLGDTSNRWLDLWIADSTGPGAVNFGGDIAITNSASNTLSITGANTVNLTDGADTIAFNDNTTLSWNGGDSTLFQDGTADSFLWAGMGILTLREDLLAADSPTLQLDNDAVAAAGLNLGRINFSGNDSAAGNPVYGFIRGEIVDHTDTTEDGELRIGLIVNGSADEEFIFEANAFSPNVSADANLGTASRPWGKLILVTNTANTIDFDSGAGGQTISHASAGDLLTFSTGSGEYIFAATSDAAAQPDITLDNDRATPTAGDNLPALIWRGNDSGAANQEYARIRGELVDPTAASEDGQIRLSIVEAGAQVEEVMLDLDTWRPVTNDGAALGTTAAQWSDAFFAEGGVINWDNGDVTLTQTNNTLTLAGTDTLAVPLNWVMSYNSGNLTLGQDTSQRLSLTDADETANPGPILSLVRNSASPAVSDAIGQILWDGKNNLGNTKNYASIQVHLDDVTNPSTDAHMEFWVNTADTHAAELRLNGAAFSPIADGGNALGTSSLKWNGAFLSQNSALNFDNGDSTITDGADVLAFASASSYTFDNDVVIASTQPLSFNAGDVLFTHATTGPGTVNISGGVIANTRLTVTVDAATTFAITSNVIDLQCTGAETINTITGASSGTILTLFNTDTECTIADDDNPTAANAIDLTGAGANDVGAVAKVITLVYDGTTWFQTAESDN